MGKARKVRIDALSVYHLFEKGISASKRVVYGENSLENDLQSLTKDVKALARKIEKLIKEKEQEFI